MEVSKADFKVTYFCRFGESTRDEPDRKAGYPGPGETEVPMQPNADGIFTNGRRTKLPKNDCPKPGEKVKREDPRDKDGLGPGQYTIKYPKQAPTFSFGNRFDTKIKGKIRMPAHLRAMEVDAPGPVQYKLPSSIKDGRRTADDAMLGLTTFGRAGRGALQTNDGPAPNKYRPVQFTEASHAYTMPRAVDNLETLKDGSRVGPGEYNIKGMSDTANLATSFPKGTRDDPTMKNNGFPGPDAYNINPPDNIPGFRIFKPMGES